MGDLSVSTGVRRRRAWLAVLAGIGTLACARPVTVSTYDNGATSLEIEWRGRARDGRFVQYHPDGARAVETRYRAGLRDGDFRVWHANGRPAVEGQFVLGLREGLWTEWDEAGTKRIEGSWRAGDKAGDGWEYDETGKLVEHALFQDGTRVARLPESAIVK